MSGVRVLIAGAGGQLGRELARTPPSQVRLSAPEEGEFDVTDPDAVARAVDAHRPHWIINAAAYTAVDRAEQEQALAYRVNRDGAANLAEAAQRSGARLIHISTDFVFNGRSSSPYLTTDQPDPLCVYGASKQAGDEAVEACLGADALIIRTAWVYSALGNNFVRTMLRLMQERDELNVVADQIGTPTWAASLAEAIWQALAMDLRGLHHWTDAGVASWYDFAVAIREEAEAIELVNRPCAINPISTEAYPLPARRPAYSVLDKQATWQALGVTGRHWRSELRRMLAELQQSA